MKITKDMHLINLECSRLLFTELVAGRLAPCKCIDPIPKRFEPIHIYYESRADLYIIMYGDGKQQEGERPFDVGARTFQRLNNK